MTAGGVGAGIVALLAGLTAFGVVRAGKRGVAQLLRDAFRGRGLDPDWGEALGRQESDLKADAVNLTGPDGARGGSWGPTQISAQTARAWGYQGPMERLTTDTAFAAQLTADMVAAGFSERGGQTYFYGPPDSLEQLGAVWNAGRAYDDPNLPTVTRDYVAKLASIYEDMIA